MSVQMTSFGPLGWHTDRAGYRYVSTHPETGQPWPKMPAQLSLIWRKFALCDVDPDSCLVNFYGPGARMGMHADSDEEDFSIPVVSISLGDTAIFRIGGLSRRDPSFTFPLASGDVVILAGAARRAYHGIDRVISGSSNMLPDGGRLNLTLRRARRRD